MPYYYKAGNIPHKRHTQFRKPDGGLYSEQLFSTEGFSNDSSLL
ncbi:MAG: homogentisate 1,2-dioxygenase, partial [Bacteroidota bacterium]|nr:homogentisate 1,2-dioxygenase [Bacteroidota bacterium]